jgi:hypothetical protein
LFGHLSKSPQKHLKKSISESKKLTTFVRKICLRMKSSRLVGNVKTKDWITAFVVATVILLVSCEQTEKFSTGLAFFPLEEGLFWEYNVTEENYAAGATPVRRNYQLRERVGGAFTVANQPVFRLERYTRSNAQMPWRLDSVWTVQRTTTEARRTENNQVFVKMVFPVQENTRWMANAARGISYRYRNAFESYRTYNQAVEVVERDDSSAINLYRKREWYAEAVGLFFKENTSLDYCQSSPSCIGRGQIEFGKRQIWQLTKYGKE